MHECHQNCLRSRAFRTQCNGKERESERQGGVESIEERSRKRLIEINRAREQKEREEVEAMKQKEKEKRERAMRRKKREKDIETYGTDKLH